MFRISVITDEVSQDLKVVASFAKRFNIDGIEIRSIWGRNPQNLLEKVCDIRRVLSEHDLEVSAIASPFFKANIDNEREYREHIDILKKCIELARKLDTKIVRGFTFWRKGRLEDYLNQIIEKYQKPLEIIESEDIILGIENEPSTFTGNGRELATFLSEIKSKNVKAIWDPGNDIFDPLGEIPYPNGYCYVRKWIVHVHVKDGVRRGKDGEPEWTAIGNGEVPYKKQFKALREDGYKGYISLETHWRLKRKISEKSIVQPGGEGFSYGGEEASEICMRNLLKILNKLNNLS